MPMATMQSELRFGDLLGDAKSLGAYYTDTRVAEFLSWWAIRSEKDTILDPSFGAGVFLIAGSRRLAQLGGRPKDQVYGVEIDSAVFHPGRGRLVDEHGLNPANLLHADFFSIEPARIQADAAIGNPPFIRYQRFAGEMRKRALSWCRARGVRLPELCSSWAPFLVHTISMLRPCGRLAMVIPMEIGHARYAQPVLEHVRRSFGSATFLTFRERLFPDLNEDTVLLLADDYGAAPARFLWRDLAHPGELTVIREQDHRPLARTRTLDAPTVASGATRLIESFVPGKARRLYHELVRSGRARRLGALADVRIGYVTGANDYFHLSPRRAEQYSIPPEYLKPAVRRGRALSGLRFTVGDWRSAVDAKEAGLLLHIEKGQTISDNLYKYINVGEENDIHRGYKCRTRSPWYCVPHVRLPDAFLTYMSGAMPRLVANDAKVYAPNSLHVLRLHPSARMSSDALAALWQTSLTRLSVEIEGHALGGGMLKLEPTEAENVLVPFPDRRSMPRLVELATELDDLARTRGDDAARERADRVILQDLLGLSEEECRAMLSGANALRTRRGYGDPAHGVA